MFSFLSYFEFEYICVYNSIIISFIFFVLLLSLVFVCLVCMVVFLGTCMHAELMVLGFISLLLTFGQQYIAKVCIPIEAADTMLPCPYRGEEKEGGGGGGDHRRRLLWYERRYLAGGGDGPGCKEVILLSHFLHEFWIFFLTS